MRKYAVLGAVLGAYFSTKHIFSDTAVIIMSIIAFVAFIILAVFAFKDNRKTKIARAKHFEESFKAIEAQIEENLKVIRQNNNCILNN